MIPADLAARLRMITEASFFDSEPPIQGTAKTREIQARLPQLLPGQQFTASIQRPLPDGTFQAVVAGREMTLALNHSAKPGDTLELIVTKNTPKAVFAQLANPAATQTADPGRSSLSPTGRLISFLLTGQPSPQPANLAGGKPLLNAPPANAGAAAPTFAPILRQAVAQSGLFYESHQLQWLSGKLDTAALLEEPQGQQGQAGRGGSAQQGAPAGQPAAAASQTAAQAQGGARPGATAPPVTGVTPLAGGQGRGEAAQEASQQAQAGAQQTGQRMPMVPERLIPVVHQQLDGMATQTYVLHAQAWPGQQVEWVIEDNQGGGGEEGSDSDAWNTTLRLRMPVLGQVDASLQLTRAGVAIRLHADDAESATRLEANRELLEAALEASGISLTGFMVEHGTKPEQS